MNDSPRTFVTFDICASCDENEFAGYQQLIQETNPNGQRKVIEAIYLEAPKVEFAMQEKFGITASCSRSGLMDTKFSCGAFAVGERRADRLYNYFRHTQALLSAQYLKYQVAGAEQDDAGNFVEVMKEYNAIVYVRGLSDYPQLFNTEWQP